VASVALAVVFVESVEEGRVDQSTWPNHTGRPDDELAKKSTEAEAEDLRPKGEEDLEAHGSGLAIEYALCEDDLG
jgi:hypothetical protein